MQDNRNENAQWYYKFPNTVAAVCAHGLYRNGSFVKTYYTRVNGYDTPEECWANYKNDSCGPGESEAEGFAAELCK